MSSVLWIVLCSDVCGATTPILDTPPSLFFYVEKTVFIKEFLQLQSNLILANEEDTKETGIIQKIARKAHKRA